MCAYVHACVHVSVPACMPVCVFLTRMCVLLEGLSAPHAQVLVLLKISNPLPNTRPTQD